MFAYIYIRNTGRFEKKLIKLFGEHGMVKSITFHMYNFM